MDTRLKSRAFSASLALLLCSLASLSFVAVVCASTVVVIPFATFNSTAETPVALPANVTSVVLVANVTQLALNSTTVSKGAYFMLFFSNNTSTQSEFCGRFKMGYKMNGSGVYAIAGIYYTSMTPVKYAEIAVTDYSGGGNDTISYSSSGLTSITVSGHLLISNYVFSASRNVYAYVCNGAAYSLDTTLSGDAYLTIMDPMEYSVSEIIPVVILLGVVGAGFGVYRRKK